MKKLLMALALLPLMAAADKETVDGSMPVREDAILRVQQNKSVESQPENHSIELIPLPEEGGCVFSDTEDRFCDFEYMNGAYREIYPDGTKVHIHAIPKPGYDFAGWYTDSNCLQRFEGRGDVDNDMNSRIWVQQDCQLWAKFIVNKAPRVVVPNNAWYAGKWTGVLDYKGIRGATVCDVATCEMIFLPEGSWGADCHWQTMGNMHIESTATNITVLSANEVRIVGYYDAFTRFEWEAELRKAGDSYYRAVQVTDGNNWIEGVLHQSSTIDSLDCMFEIIPGEVVSIDTALIGYMAKGLPSGLKYDKKTGKITGAAKKPTAEGGVTVKFTKKGEADVTMTVVVGPVPTINVTLEGDTEKCKVTGGNKTYLVGKKVTLQAKGPKGTAFVGWFKDGEPWPSAEESKNTKLSYVMTKESISLVATFEKEKMSVACPGLASASFTVGVAGGAEGMPIEIETQSGVKSVAVSKLPTGMKYDKKTGLIVGAPTKAGSFDVTIKVTAKSGAVETLVVPIKVEPLPDWLVGTYEGWFHDVYYGDVSWDDGVVGEWGGRAILTVSSSGIVSGKMVGSDGEHPIQKAQISRAVDGGFECNVRSDHDTAVCIVFSKTNVAGRDRGMATANWRHVNKWNEHIESTVVGWQNRWKDGSGNKLSPAFVKGTVMPICMENMLETCGSRRGLPYGGWLTLKYDKDGSLRTVFSETQGGKATATGSAQMVPCDLGDDGRIKLLTTVVLKPKNREPFALVLDLSVSADGVISEEDVVVEDYLLSVE